MECCKYAAAGGIKNVLVTAAYIHPEPLRNLAVYLNAVNVDLKAFTDEFYQTICNAHLEPVLNAIKLLKKSGVFIEITNLLIPTLNDSNDEIKKMVDWIAEHTGTETPLHFSRFYPQHQLQHLPVTPEEKLIKAREIAMNGGLKYVYIGNMPNRAGEITRCPGCNALLIDRSRYQVTKNRIEQCKCPHCNRRIPGIWN